MWVEHMERLQQRLMHASIVLEAVNAMLETGLGARAGDRLQDLIILLREVEGDVEGVLQSLDGGKP